jgi:hypothetical protein
VARLLGKETIGSPAVRGGEPTLNHSSPGGGGGVVSSGIERLDDEACEPWIRWVAVEAEFLYLVAGSRPTAARACSLDVDAALRFVRDRGGIQRRASLQIPSWYMGDHASAVSSARHETAANSVGFPSNVLHRSGLCGSFFGELQADGSA